MDCFPLLEGGGMVFVKGRMMETTRGGSLELDFGPHQNFEGNIEVYEKIVWIYVFAFTFSTIII